MNAGFADFCLLSSPDLSTKFVSFVTDCIDCDKLALSPFTGPVLKRAMLLVGA